MDKIKIGYIGLGGRGMWLLKDVVLAQGEEVVAVCDKYEDRMEDGAKLVEEKSGKRPLATTNYMDVINCDEVNTVIIATSWETHVEISVAAMNAGKAVGVEVAGAYTIEQCWELVDTYERTKTPFMLFENCCFGRRELMALNMVEKGVFGKVVHCEGAYRHDLRYEIIGGKKNRHYRLRNYMMRNCDNYPTHELGPIARILNINHGNRFVSLVSVASKSEGLHDYVLKNSEEYGYLTDTQFNQGDVVTTIIKCANGETVTMTLDTSLPRYYSRGFVVSGTNGMYEEATDSVYMDTEEDMAEEYVWLQKKAGNAKDYEAEYEHPIWQQYIKEGVQGSHDGMDWLEFKKFFGALRANEPMPVDVYDAATWMAITPLTEMSIAQGSVPVAIPDFTRGRFTLDIID